MQGIVDMNPAGPTGHLLAKATPLAPVRKAASGAVLNAVAGIRSQPSEAKQLSNGFWLIGYQLGLGVSRPVNIDNTTTFVPSYCRYSFSMMLATVSHSRSLHRT